MSVTKVVILNWNGEIHLQKFLPSVIANTPRDVEIIVADNGSTDNSINILTSDFPSVTIFQLNQNYGFAEGYNQALKAIDADYCILLNSDVETPAGWVEPLIKTLDSDKEIAATAPKILSYNDKSRFEYAGAAGGFIDYLGYPFCQGRILDATEVDCGQYDTPREVFWASGAAFACRTDVFRQLGGFDSDFFAHMEEIDLCWRMQLAGYKVVTTPNSCVYHLGGGTLNIGSPTKVMLNHRNNLAMLYKCSSPQQRCVVALLRPLLDLAAAISYLLQGHTAQCRAVANAYIDFIKWHKQLSQKRKTIRSGCHKMPKTIYNGSIVARYIFGKHEFNNII